jgi:hypothetical protein
LQGGSKTEKTSFPSSTRQFRKENVSFDKSKFHYICSAKILNKVQETATIQISFQLKTNNL